MLGLAIAWALFVPVPDWLAHHDIGAVTGSLHETALDNARGRLLTLGAGLLVAGALGFTARTFYLSREGQVTDRYTKAIEQLGSDKLDVRIGGIYALERVARDSARDHPTVMEVLTAFVREHSHEQHPPAHDGPELERSTRADVQAALTVIGRRDAKRDTRQIVLGSADLTRADLSYAKLVEADLARADLGAANLYRANITSADLGAANLYRANLTSADLGYANLSEANLGNADLTRANLTRANLDNTDFTRAKLGYAKLVDAVLFSATLSEAQLSNADLTRANLGGAHLDLADLGHVKLVDAYLRGATLTRATLRGADLTGADLTDTDLSGADLRGAMLSSVVLTGARWPAAALVPEGWKLEVGSGRLAAAGTDSAPEEAN